MRAVSKKVSSIALVLAGASVTVACGGHGPNSYLMPKDAVVAKLANAEKQFQYGSGDMRAIRATSRSGDIIKVRLPSVNGTGSTRLCEAQVEAIDEEWTRVTPVCSKTDDALENTMSEILEMQVDEFVIAVLYDKPIDSAMVAKRTSAVAIDNIGEISREARAAQEAATDSAYSPSSDWDRAEASGSDWGS